MTRPSSALRAPSPRTRGEGRSTLRVPRPTKWGEGGRRPGEGACRMTCSKGTAQRMRSLHALLVALTLFAANAYAVAPQFWRVRSADEFLGGEIEGFAVTSRGELRPGPTVRKIATFTDPFVLSQATAPNGDRYFGTGNDGKVYRLRGTEMKLFYTAPEPELYALAFHDDALYVGSSPNGKVYKVDPNDAARAAVFYEPKQAYIWALSFLTNGDLAVAT